MAERSTRERPSSAAPSSHHPTSSHSSNPPSHTSTPSLDTKGKDPKEKSFFQSLFNRGPGIRNGSTDSIPSVSHSRKTAPSSGLSAGITLSRDALGLSPTGQDVRDLPHHLSHVEDEVTGPPIPPKMYTQAELEERMVAVGSSAFAGLSIGEKIEAVEGLEHFLTGASRQAKLERDMEILVGETKETGAMNSLTPDDEHNRTHGLQHGAQQETRASPLYLPREQLIGIALRISDMDRAMYKQKLRLCGFSLLHMLLSDEGFTGNELNPTPTTTTRIIELALSPLPSNKSSTSYSVSDEITHRLLVLEDITHHGADISRGHSLGLVKVVVDWIKCVGKEWTAWCGSGGDLEDDMGHTSPAGGRSQSKETGGLGILSPPAPRPFNLPSADDRDSSPATGRSDFGESTGATPVTTLSHLFLFLRCIAQHNLPLFTPADVALLITLHISLLESGIKACQEYKATQAVVSGETNTRSRSLSTSGPANVRRSPSRILAPESRSGSQASDNLSRRASVKRQTAGGFSVPMATVPLPQVSRGTDAADDIVTRGHPRWTTMLRPYVDGVRGCLESKAVPPNAISALVESMCFAAGSCAGMAQDDAYDEIGRLMRELISDVVIGRTSERVLRSAMENRSEITDERHLVVALGSVMLVRVVLHHTQDNTLEDEVTRMTGPGAALPTNFSFHSLAGSLAKAVRSARHDTSICSEVLGAIQDRLDRLESNGHAETSIEASTADIRAHHVSSLDAWAEGDSICSLLRVFTTADVTGGLPILRFSAAEHEGQASVAAVSARFYDVVQRLPFVLGSLQSSSTNPVFWHPELVALLMSISERLPADLCLDLIEHHRIEGLCLPGCTEWKANASRLLGSFYERSTRDVRPLWSLRPVDEGQVRIAAARLVFKQTYESVKDFSDSRRQLGTKVILPALERCLEVELDEEINRWCWEVLTSLAVRETIEQDEARRQAELLSEEEPTAAHHATDGPPEATGEIFKIVRTLLLRLARQTFCISASGEVIRPMSPSGESEDAASVFGTMSGHMPSRDHSVAPGIRRDLMASPSPMVTTEASPTDDAAGHSRAQGREHVHTQCRSLQACNTMIALFTRLAFSMPHALITNNAKYARLPASASCITLFDDMLRLVAPNVGSVSRQEMTSASCAQARLSILQWLMRLRANTQHRIWVKPALDDQALAPAAILGRLREKAKPEAATNTEETSTRRRPLRADPPTTERGRDHRILPEMITGRSRSRSRQPPPAREPRNATRMASKPLWYIPDELSFELPADARPSEGMTTYDPASQASVAAGTHNSRSGVWLKISKYIEVLIAILTVEYDWELVSYTLAFLPFQLANKHFFCGPTSADWLRALRKQLCESLAADDKIATQTVLPSGVRRTDVRAVAYQTLTVLISYKRLYTKKEHSQIVETFSRGLSGGHKGMAKTCIQALTLAAYELQDGLVTHVPSILELLMKIMTSPELSAHILEFLYALGQAPTLYQNFTEAQYQTVFKIAVSYIQVHNDVRVREEMSTEDEDFTLSQHVIGMSYFCIYVWFIAVGLGRRPRYVTLLTKNILAAFPGGKIDELAEVCFDWLSRYTYGNADPKPAVDPMEPIVFGDGVDYPTKHWLLGNGVISLQTQPQTGWTKITMRRASGMVVMLAKVQNVPVVGLGEENADLFLEPAVMERNRNADTADRPAASAPLLIQGDATARAEVSHQSASEGHAPRQHLLLSSSPTDRFGMAPLHSPLDGEQFSFIWAGSTPSQRRKTVTVDPGFIGLQLSAYPYISIHAPRGRLIPPEAQVERTIRALDNTPVIDTHKVAVLYVGPGQTSEIDILANRDGSPAFLRFVAGLGRLIKLKDQRDVYPGGLDTRFNNDGEYAYAWWDDLAQVVFHTPHLMPNEQEWPGEVARNVSKKLHVGNDKVKVVFNDSGLDYAFDTIACQFNYINIVISSHTSGVSGAFNDSAEHDFFKVTIQKVKGIPDFSAVGDMKLVSAAALPTFIRQLVILADLMVSVHDNTITSGREEYVSSWRHRHRTIARLREKLGPVADTASMTETEQMEYTRDFTRGF